MSIRSQVYEWNAGRSGGPKNTIPLPVGGNNSTQTRGKPFSIFVGGYGNNLLELPYTTSTQFVVIEEYGCTPTLPRGVMASTSATPYRGLTVCDKSGTTLRDGSDNAYTYISGPRAFLQIRINTTMYFKDPDGVVRDGLPGTAIPYPKSMDYCAMFSEDEMERINILPNQTWDVRLVYYNWEAFKEGGEKGNGGALIQDGFRCFIKYTLYDGSDALIASLLLQHAIAVTPDNLNWFRARMQGLNYGKLVDNKYVLPPDM